MADISCPEVVTAVLLIGAAVFRYWFSLDIRVNFAVQCQIRRFGALKGDESSTDEHQMNIVQNCADGNIDIDYHNWNIVHSEKSPPLLLSLRHHARYYSRLLTLTNNTSLSLAAYKTMPLSSNAVGLGLFSALCRTVHANPLQYSQEANVSKRQNGKQQQPSLPPTIWVRNT